MVEVIGSSPTAPTNKATAALKECGGRFIRAGRTAGSTSFVNAASAVFLPRDSRLRETAKPLPPHHSRTFQVRRSLYSRGAYCGSTSFVNAASAIFLPRDSRLATSDCVFKHASGFILCGITRERNAVLAKNTPSDRVQTQSLVATKRQSLYRPTEAALFECGCRFIV